MQVLKNFPDDEKLQAAIVIPSYDEGAGVLPTIRAWLRQSISSGVRAALFVVVNNSKKSSSDIKDSNRLTHELVESLLKEDMLPSLKLDGEVWQEFSKLKELVLSTRFRLALVDLWSKRHAPDKCNVGMARDVGARVAGQYVRDDGFFVMSDADTTPGRRYLYQAELYLRFNQDIDAIKGDVYVKDSKDPEAKKRSALMRLSQTLENQMRSFWLDEDFGKFERRLFPHLAGSNTVVRKKVYESAGGIPHINGAEDTELSRKILRKGGKIYNAGPRVSVDTSARISLRTEAGHGLGQGIREVIDYLDTPWEFPVLSLQACRFAELLLELLSEANQEGFGDKERWKEYILQRLSVKGEDLEEDHLERLWQANQADLTLVEVHFNRLLAVEVDKIAEEIYGKEPFYVVLAHFRQALGLRRARPLSAEEYLDEVRRELFHLGEVVDEKRSTPKPQWNTKDPQPVFLEEYLQSLNWFDEILLLIYFLLQGVPKRPEAKTL